jgi:hypothetical protein
MVPDANILLSGYGVNLAVTITIAADVSGFVTIALTARSGIETRTTTFTLTVVPQPDKNFIVKLTPKGAPLKDGQFTRQFGSVRINDDTDVIRAPLMNSNRIRLLRIVENLADSGAVVNGRPVRPSRAMNFTNRIGNVRTLTITNTGTTTLKGLRILRDGENARDFFVQYSRKPLEPKQSMTVKVTFRPRAPGVREAGLHIYSIETPANPFDLSLTGQGLGRRKFHSEKSGQ